MVYSNYIPYADKYYTLLLHFIYLLCFNMCINLIAIWINFNDYHFIKFVIQVLTTYQRPLSFRQIKAFVWSYCGVKSDYQYLSNQVTTNYLMCRYGKLNPGWSGESVNHKASRPSQTCL